MGDVTRLDPGEDEFMHEHQIYFLIGNVFQFLARLGFLLRISRAFIRQMLKLESWMKALGRRSKEAVVERQRQAKAKAEARRKFLLDNPQINTNEWDLHCWRLTKYNYSHYQGDHIYMGPRGGIYTVTANGNRNYR